MKRTLIAAAVVASLHVGAHAAVAAPQQQDVAFWNTSGYSFGGFNSTTQISDGLGGTIGITYGVNPGYGTWNWNAFNGIAPAGVVNDYAGVNSFNGGDFAAAGFNSTNGVNSVRSQLSDQFTANHNQYKVTLDFSKYKGSATTGGTDGQAGASTLIGLSDFYAGNYYATTTISFSAMLANGTAGSTAGWSLLNGDRVGSWTTTGGFNSANVNTSFTNGVLRGTPDLAVAGDSIGNNTDKLDAVLGMLKLDNAGYKSVTLTYDIYRGPNNIYNNPRRDNSGLYVASLLPEVVPPTSIETLPTEYPNTATPVTAPVPEPETYALMLAGLAAVVGAARRRKSA